MMSTPNVIKERFVQSDFDSYGTHHIMLGKPVMRPFLVPVLHNTSPTCFNEPFLVNGEFHNVTAMTFETPHGVVFVDDIDSVNVHVLGKAIAEHTLFPNGASVVFVQKADEENLKARVWLRGHGEVPFTHEAVGVAGAVTILFSCRPIDKINVSMGERKFLVNRNINEEISIFFEE